MKQFISIAIMAITFSFGFTSCSLFEGDGFDSKNVGNLDRDRADYDMPIGYRVKSVGNIRYLYKSNGKLDLIRIGSTEYDLDKRSYSYEEDGHLEEYTYSFNANNFLTKIKISYRDDAKEAKGDGTYELSYNSDKQLSQITSSYTETFKENGKSEKIVEKTSIDFTYTLMRVKRIKLKYEVKETIDGETDKDTYTATIGFNYDDDEEYYNRYYQWTPNVIKYGLDLDDNVLLTAMAYIGMLGRASTMLPESIDIEDKDGNRTKYCSYSHNTYDAIKKADGIDYTYTEKEDDYEVKPYIDFETRAAMPVVNRRSHLRHSPFRK